MCKYSISGGIGRQMNLQTRKSCGFDSFYSCRDPDIFLAGFDRRSKMHRQVGGPGPRHASRTCLTYVAPDNILRGVCSHVNSQYFNKPAWTELLPPPLPSPHQKPYTLLVSMDDLLITSIWDVSSKHRDSLSDNVTSSIATKRLADSQTSRRRLFPCISISVL